MKVTITTDDGEVLVQREFTEYGLSDGRLSEIKFQSGHAIAEAAMILRARAGEDRVGSIW